jgi:predicted MPP superfamily phosphohydrolase
LETINVIKHDLGADLEKINIYPIADLHIGSVFHNRKELEALLQTVQDDPVGYIVLNGDLINNAIKTSVSDIYEERVSPEEQNEELVQLFKPLRERILSITTGNHEQRTWRIAGIDIIKHFCYRLGIEDLYHPVGSVVFLSFGKSRGRENVRNTLSLYHRHGHGGGSTVGGKANKLQKMSNAVQANIYVHSHTHTPIIFKEDFFVANNANKGVGRMRRLFVNTNAYEGFGGYGHTMGLTPSNNEHIVISVWYDKTGRVYYNATL